MTDENKQAQLPRPRRTEAADVPPSHRAARRAAEDVPAADYCERMERLGPREGESYLAFCKRLSMLHGVRPLWIEVWRDCAGNQVECAKHMGIPRGNVAYELRLVGLSRELLDMLCEVST